ncbi:hypothetical protein ACLB2K_049785 [Fragaria x ananassa]
MFVHDSGVTTQQKRGLGHVKWFSRSDWEDRPRSVPIRSPASTGEGYLYFLLAGGNQVAFVLVFHRPGSLLHWRRSLIRQEFGGRAGVGGSMERLTFGLAMSRWSDPDGAVRSLPCSRCFNQGGQRTETHTIGFMGLGCVICWVLGLRLMFNGPGPGLWPGSKFSAHMWYLS